MATSSTKSKAPTKGVAKPSSPSTGKKTASSSAKKPAAKPASKPSVKPATKPAAKPAAKTAAKPAAKTVSKPASKPAVKPVKPAEKPAPKSAAKPVAKPAPKPAAKPAKPAAKPAASKPAAKPEKPAAKPAPKPVVKPAAKPAPKPAAKPAKPAAKPAKPAPEPVAKPAAKPAAKKPVASRSSHDVRKLPDQAVIAPPPVIHPAGPNTKKLVKSEILELREQLLADREQLRRVVTHLHGSSLAQSEGINLEEDGTELSSQIFGLHSAADAEDRIRQIDEALRAIDAGTYGYCTICGNMINPLRLRALPSAKTCIRCQSAAENQNSGHIFVRGRI